MSSFHELIEIIPEQLLDTKFLNEQDEYGYYISKMSMFLKNSYGMAEQLQMLLAMLKYVNDGGTKLFKLLDIYDPDYFLNNRLSNDTYVLVPEIEKNISDYPKYYIRNNDEFVKAISIEDNYDKTHEYYKLIENFLDILANIVGASRTVKLEIPSETGGEPEIKIINFSNQELLTLIKLKIAKNNFDGTIGNLVKNYKDIGIQVIVINDISTPGVATLYFGMQEGFTKNILDTMLYADYIIRPMGITYQLTVRISGYDTFIIGDETKGILNSEVNLLG